jgi:hypothetical protein
MLAREQTIDGVDMFCMRYQYTCPNFDKSLLEESYIGIGERLFGRPEKYHFDSEGRQWISRALLGENVARHFISQPTQYLVMAQVRHKDFCQIETLVRHANAYVGSKDPAEISVAIGNLSEAYILALKYIHIAQLIVEFLFDRLSEIVSDVLPRKQANIFLSSICEAPASAEAIRQGFIEDTRGTKRIDAVKSDPVMIFARTILPRSIALDPEVATLVFEGQQDLAEYWSLRTIAPLAVQLAEQFRYADYSLRTHLKHFLNQARKNVPGIGDPYAIRWRDLVSSIAISAVDAP